MRCQGLRGHSNQLEGGGEEIAIRSRRLTLEELVCALSRPRDAACASASSVGYPFIQERARGAGPIAAGGRMGSWDALSARRPEIPATRAEERGLGTARRGRLVERRDGG